MLLASTSTRYLGAINHALTTVEISRASIATIEDIEGVDCDTVVVIMIFLFVPFTVRLHAVVLAEDEKEDDRRRHNNTNQSSELRARDWYVGNEIMRKLEKGKESTALT
jgi:hypothetical protein